MINQKDSNISETKPAYEFARVKVRTQVDALDKLVRESVCPRLDSMDAYIGNQLSAVSEAIQKSADYKINLIQNTINNIHNSISQLSSNVSGPASSTDNEIAIFNGFGGNKVKNSGVAIYDGIISSSGLKIFSADNKGSVKIIYNETTKSLDVSINGSEYKSIISSDEICNKFSNITFKENSSPTICQQINSCGVGNGQDFTIHAQDVKGLNGRSFGGNLKISAGDGLGLNDVGGNLYLAPGAGRPGSAIYLGVLNDNYPSIGSIRLPNSTSIYYHNSKSNSRLLYAVGDMLFIGGTGANDPDIYIDGANSIIMRTSGGQKALMVSNAMVEMSTSLRFSSTVSCPSIVQGENINGLGDNPFTIKAGSSSSGMGSDLILSSGKGEKSGSVRIIAGDIISLLVTDSGINCDVPLKLRTYYGTDLPSAAEEGKLIYIIEGLKKNLAVSDGEAWVKLAAI
jgi:hypothetical protein